MINDNSIELVTSVEFEGQRLDHYISSSQENISRALAKKLIDEKLILVNNKFSKPSYKLKKEDKITIPKFDLEKINVESENIKLDVVYEDKDLIVVNKPQGMVTHPASGIYSGTLVNALLFHCGKSLSGINGVLRPGIVHRLDKDTSGLIISCKNDKAHNEIAKQIKTRKLKRHYYAVVHGKLIHNLGAINKPIGRDRIHRYKMAVVKDGREAITHWKVLKSFEKHTFLECTLETGRTHQIRVHMSSIGHPILGDKTYGKKNDDELLMMLHAYKIVFVHPTTKKTIKLETDIPERFKKKLARC